MYKLLKAEFFRLKRNKIFWGLIVITLGIACIMSFNSINSFSTDKGIDKLLINYINIIGLFIAIFTSLFTGVEYSDGTIRNKIIIGHSKASIYLVTLIINIIVGVFIELVYMLVVTVIGLPIFGGLEMTLSQFCIILLNIIMIIVTYATIFTTISLLCSDITISTVINIILVLLMYVAGQSLYLTANSEEFIYCTTYYEEGKVEREIIGINPNYPGETKKKICKFILYIMPTGQASILSNNSDSTDKNILLLYSIGVTVIFATIGGFLFNKKELK